MSEAQSEKTSKDFLTFNDIKSRHLEELEALLDFLNESDDVNGGVVSYHPEQDYLRGSKARLWLAAPELSTSPGSGQNTTHRYDLTEIDEDEEREIFREALDTHSGLDVLKFKYHGIDVFDEGATEVTIAFRVPHSKDDEE